MADEETERRRVAAMSVEINQFEATLQVGSARQPMLFIAIQ